MFLLKVDAPSRYPTDPISDSLRARIPEDGLNNNASINKPKETSTIAESDDTCLAAELICTP